MKFVTGILGRIMYLDIGGWNGWVNVVYFGQCLGTALSKRWLKSAFSTYFLAKAAKMIKNEAKISVFYGGGGPDS